MYLGLVNKPVVNQLLSVGVCVHVCACLCVGVWRIRQKLPPAAMRFQLRIIHMLRVLLSFCLESFKLFAKNFLWKIC